MHTRTQSAREHAQKLCVCVFVGVVRGTPWRFWVDNETESACVRVMHCWCSNATRAQFYKQKRIYFSVNEMYTEWYTVCCTGRAPRAIRVENFNRTPEPPSPPPQPDGFTTGKQYVRVFELYYFGFGSRVVVGGTRSAARRSLFRYRERFAARSHSITLLAVGDADARRRASVHSMEMENDHKEMDQQKCVRDVVCVCAYNSSSSEHTKRDHILPLSVVS